MYSVLKIFGLWGKFMRVAYDIYEWLMFKSDKPRKYLWQKFFNLICWKFPSPKWRNMNCGYAVDTESGKTIELDREFEDERFNYQLYHYVCTGFKSIEDYEGKHVAEIGSGRGGGLSFILKYLRPKSALGIDFSRQHFNFCKKHYDCKNLNFSWGDAENLPIKSESIDYVVCIDASHCFGNLKACLSEIDRILKKGGRFFLADFVSTADRDEYEDNFDGFLRLVEKKDISENVLMSLRLDTRRKVELIERVVPLMLRRGMKRFAAIEGSTLYNQIEAGDAVYIAYHFVKD